MTAQRYCKFRCNKVLIDVDTQKDLLLADGAASVHNHRRVLANIRRVMASARHEHIPTISTARMVQANDRHPGFCVAGTQGCKKLSYTVRDNYVYFGSSDSTDLPDDLLYKYDQVIFSKRTSDPFDEPRLDRMLTELYATEIFVIGATLEGAVKETVDGLLARGHNVTVLIDAVGSRNRTAAEKAVRKMAARGTRMARTTEVLGTSMLKTVHACDCPRCRSAAEQKQTAEYGAEHSLAV
ncbi:MAG: cysteine hydrolase family protein [Planctomycetota bacterium]